MIDIKEHQQDIVNEELAEKSHQSVIEKLKTRRVHARFKDNIWTSDLVEMGSLSSKNQGVKYLLRVIDIFTKYSFER